MLEFVRSGVNARLHPYNTHCLDAMEPLLQIQARGWLALGMEIIGRVHLVSPPSSPGLKSCSILLCTSTMGQHIFHMRKPRQLLQQGSCRPWQHC